MQLARSRDGAGETALLSLLRNALVTRAAAPRNSRNLEARLRHAGRRRPGWRKALRRLQLARVQAESRLSTRLGRLSYVAANLGAKQESAAIM